MPESPLWQGLPQRRATGGHVLVASEVEGLIRRLASWLGPVENGPFGPPAALGRALGGERVTLLLQGEQLPAAASLLDRATSQHLPMVVYVTASDHEADDVAHLAAATGAVTLTACDGQEGLDLGLVARRVTETLLRPAVVTLDRTLATSVATVLAPEADLVERFLGRADDTLHAEGLAQELVLGKHRRRVPRWHDAARPMMTGTRPRGESRSAARAARRLYFDSGRSSALQEAFADFEETTGRHYGSLHASRLRSAQLLLVTLGGSLRQAEEAAEILASEKLRMGVVALRALGPLPEAELVALLAGRRDLLVVERGESSAAGGGQLTAMLRSALERGLERRDRRHSKGERSGTARSLTLRQLPRICTASAGAEARPADLAEVGRLLLAGEELPAVVELGLETLPTKTDLPKRRVLFDALRRHAPQVAGAGVRAGNRGASRPATGDLLVARIELPDALRLAREGAELLFEAMGGSVGARATGGLGDDGATPDSVELFWSPGAPSRSGEPATPATDSPADLLVTARPVAEPEEAETLIIRPGSLTPDQRLGALLCALAAVPRSDGTLERQRLLDAYEKRLGTSESPEAAATLAAFEAGWEWAAGPARRRTEAPDSPTSGPLFPPPHDRPDAAPVERLAHYWDETGILYDRQTSGEEEWAPTPGLVSGAVPALATSLIPNRSLRTSVPAFDAALCTGCGACWSLCPHGAIRPLLADAGGLLELGMEQARTRGESVDGLRPVLGKLTRELDRGLESEDLAEGSATPTLAGAVLDAALEATLEGSPLPAERLQAATEACSAVRETLADLPLARLQGKALSIAISPDLCKSCELCVAVCEPEALRPEVPDEQAESRSRRHWTLAREAPPPDPTLLERLAADRDVGPLASALLAPPAWRIMAGGDDSPPGDGAAIALRQVLGLLAVRLAPQQEAAAARLQELAGKLSQAIHDELARALPERDLDALADGLAAVERPDVDLGELSTRVESAVLSERVDVPRVRQLVGMARGVQEGLREAQESRRRAGAACSLVLSRGPALDWASRPPYNPFACPTAVAPPGGAVPFARGLAESAAAATVRLAGALRRAAAAVDGSRAQEPLRFADLDAAERALAVPVLLALDEEGLLSQGDGLAPLLELLAADLPLKVLLLSSDDDATTAGELGLLLLSLPRPYVAQLSLAAPNHLQRCVTEALATDGPAVLRLYAPSPQRQGFAPHETLARAERAVLDRSFPLFRRPAAEEGEPSPLDLASNPVDGEEGTATGDEDRLAVWRALRHLETIDAAEAARREGRTPSELEARHEAELDRVREEYEGRLAALRSEVHAELVQRLRSRLSRLAARGRRAAPADEKRTEGTS